MATIPKPVHAVTIRDIEVENFVSPPKENHDVQPVHTPPGYFPDQTAARAHTPEEEAAAQKLAAKYAREVMKRATAYGLANLSGEDEHAEVASKEK